MKIKNMKIAVNKQQPLDEIIKQLNRIGVDLCNLSFDGAVRVVYVSEIANEAFGAYKSSVDMDYLFSRSFTTLTELKAMTND